MLYPSIQDLTNENVNRYMLVIAAAKGARYVTYKQNQEQEYNESRKEFEKSMEDSNEKAVSIAIDRIHNGQFKILAD